MKKVKRMLVSFGMAMTMMLNLSAVSYAVQLPQLPLSLMIGQTAPVSMEQSQYSLAAFSGTGQAYRSYRPVAFSASGRLKWRIWTELRFFRGTSFTSLSSIA